MKKLLLLFLRYQGLAGIALSVIMVAGWLVFAFGYNGFNVQNDAVYLMSSSGGNEDSGDEGEDLLDCGGKCTVNGQAANCQGSSCTYKKSRGKEGCNNITSPHDLPREGQTPNSTQEKRRVCSGDIYQIRYYDSYGNARTDEDYHQPHGDQPTPHYHHWINGERDDTWSADPNHPDDR